PRDARSRIDTTFAFDRRGTVSLSATHGDIIVTGSSRDEIRVRATSDDDNLRLTTSSSRVSLDVFGPRHGDTRFEVTVPYGARVALRDVLSKSVRAGTTSGDVGFDGTIDPAGRYELSSHSGDVTLRIPRDASAQLTVSTWSGSVDSEFAITLRPGEHGIGTKS